MRVALRVFAEDKSTAQHVMFLSPRSVFVTSLTLRAIGFTLMCVCSLMMITTLTQSDFTTTTFAAEETSNLSPFLSLLSLRLSLFNLFDVNSFVLYFCQGKCANLLVNFVWFARVFTAKEKIRPSLFVCVHFQVSEKLVSTALIFIEDAAEFLK